MKDVVNMIAGMIVGATIVLVVVFVANEVPQSKQENESEVLTVASEAEASVEDNFSQSLTENMDELHEQIHGLREDILVRQAESKAAQVMESDPEPVPVAEEPSVIDCGNNQLIPVNGYMGAKVTPCGGLWLAPRSTKPGVTYTMSNGTVKVHSRK